MLADLLTLRHLTPSSWGWIGLLIFILYQIGKSRSISSSTGREDTPKPVSFTEDDVIKVQIAFEQRLECDVDLPDSIRHGAAYRYKQLMRKWYAQLIAANRYNDDRASKIRADWLDYMDALQSGASYLFSSLEASDLNRREGASEQTEFYRLQGDSLEDAFAAAIGDAAVAELHQVRSRGVFAFDRSGEHMAPIGFHFSPVSIRPYVEVLEPDSR
jgi:hypothetical protein